MCLVEYMNYSIVSRYDRYGGGQIKAIIEEILIILIWQQNFLHRRHCHKDQNIEKLADLREVLRAATIARGYILEELEMVRAKKAEKRSGFEKKILLIETIE